MGFCVEFLLFWVGLGGLGLFVIVVGAGLFFICLNGTLYFSW